MKKILLDLMNCPICQQPLQLSDFEVVDDKGLVDIVSGILICEKEHVFPIVRSIPRMLPLAMNQHIDSLKHSVDTLPAKMKEIVEKQIHFQDENFRMQYSPTQASFSSEWASVDATDNAWGWDNENRKTFFLDGFGKTSNELAGKRILDAGCGHGETIFGLAEEDVEIVAMDLSFSVDYIKNRLDAMQNVQATVHVIQGNVASHPFDEGKFDLLFSSGVLHHTPSTEHSFSQISPVVMDGGACFIFVYSNDHSNLLEKLVFHIYNFVRKLTTKLPHPILHGVCWLGAPFLWIYINTYRVLRGGDRYLNRSLRETKLSLFDALSPQFDWHHTTEEVKGWFAKNGFSQMRKTFYNHIGIGIVGVKDNS